MSWKETDPMKERIGFIAELQRGERTMSELCLVFGISRKTGYKWRERFEAAGYGGLEERSRARLHHPNAVDAAMIARLVKLRRRYGWGPQKLLDRLAWKHPQLELPASSTVAEILKRHGLVKARRRRQRSVPYGAPFVIATSPNELWSADYKGQFRTGDGRYCYPLTICDAFSRYLLCCRGLERPTAADSKAWFERAFKDYGLPAAIRTDNGTPFASTGLGALSTLSLWWLKLGIVPERIRPAHPQQNGRHERMHRTLKDGCAIAANMAAQQLALDQFRHDYNCERPHDALGKKPPHALYHASPRAYPKRVPELQYPESYAVCRVYDNGLMSWRGHTFYVNQALAGEPVGLHPIDNAAWRIYVGPLAIGILDLHKKRIEPLETYIQVPTLH